MFLTRLVEFKFCIFRLQQKEVLEFEQKFLDVCDEGVESLQIYYFAVRSFADIGGGAISDDLQFLAIGYILVIIYLTLALGKFNCRDHKVSTSTMFEHLNRQTFSSYCVEILGSGFFKIHMAFARSTYDRQN